MQSNRMLALDMRLTLADNDLRKVTRACDAAGMKRDIPITGSPFNRIRPDATSRLEGQTYKAAGLFQARVG